MEKVEDLLMLH